MAYVTIRTKGVDGYQRVLLDKDHITVGRSSSCEVRIRDASVSRQHCCLIREGNEWWIEDLGSHNGTIVEQERIAGRTRLHEGMIIAIGASRLTFHEGDLATVEVGCPSDDVTEPDACTALCSVCGQWISVAHLAPGEVQPCPRCGADIPRPAAT